MKLLHGGENRVRGGVPKPIGVLDDGIIRFPKEYQRNESFQRGFDACRASTLDILQAWAGEAERCEKHALVTLEAMKESLLLLRKVKEILSDKRNKFGAPLAVLTLRKQINATIQHADRHAAEFAHLEGEKRDD